MSGPIPVRPSSARPSGMFTWLKNGGPTVALVPWTSSERIGNRVPHRTEKAMPTNSRLLKRKLASRLTIDSSLVSAARDRKSTRLNSSHGYISYAVFCLKKKKKKVINTDCRRRDEE